MDMRIRSKGLEASVDKQGRLSVIDRESGQGYESPWSIAAPRAWWYIQQQEVRLPAEREGSFLTERAPDGKGLLVHCDFHAQGISFDLLLRIEGRCLHLRLPVSSVSETCRHDYSLLSIELLGGLGAASAGEEGFLLRPERGCSITYFTRTEQVEERHYTYSGFDIDTMLPVFGVAREKGAFLGVIHEGDFDSSMVSRIGWGDENFHAVYPQLHYRYWAGDDYDPVDREVRLNFLPGKAGYVELASAYRHYLLSEKGFPTLRERADISPALAYALQSTNIRFFVSCKQPRPDGLGPERIRATFPQIGEGLKELPEAGLDKVQVIVVGWNWEGHDGRYPSRFPVNTRLGGEEEFVRLASLAGGLGYQFGVHDNYTDIYEISPEFGPELPTVQLDGTLRHGGLWAGGHCYHCCPKVAYERFARRDMPRLATLGVKGMSYCDAFPGPWLHKCYSPEHPLHRREAAEYYLKTIRLGKQTYGSLHTESYFAYAGRDLDCALAVRNDWCPPKRQGMAIDESLIDMETPFWHIAHHGIVATGHSQINSRDEDDPGILVNIEYGCQTVWEFLTIAMDTPRDPKADVLRPRHCMRPNVGWMAECHRTANEAIRPFNFDFIVAHEEPRPGVRHTAYSSGAEFWINRTEKAVIVPGKKLPPRSWLKR